MSNSDFTKHYNSVIYNINPENRLITKEFINDIMVRFGINDKRKQIYKVNNLDYFITATTHKTNSLDVSEEEYNTIKEMYYLNYPDSNYVFIQNTNYERLEFIGDSIIKPILTDYITSYFINQNEGFLSKLRSRLEKTQFFSNLTKLLNLKDYILISRQYEETDTRNTNLSIMEDVFEAFIGALYLDAKEQKDCGYAFKVIHDLIYNIFESDTFNLDLRKMSIDDNYKDKLNSFCNMNKLPQPVYKLKDVQSITSKRGNNMYKYNEYTVLVIVREFEAIGKSKTKKDAEQKAALNMLNMITNKN